MRMYQFISSTFREVSAHKRFDGLIYLYFLFIPLIDTTNGIFLKNGLPSIAQPIKTLFIGILLLRIFTLNKFFGLLVLLVSFPFFLGDLLNLFFMQLGHYLGKDIGHSLKHMMFFTGFAYFLLFLPRIQNSLRIAYVESIFTVGFAVVSLNLLIGGLGFGYPQYVFYSPSGNQITIGTKGFYYDGNSIAALLILYGSYVCYRLWHSKRKFFFPAILFMLLLAYFKATKVALLGPFVIAVGIPFFSERSKIFRITKLKINYTALFLIFSLATGPFVYNKVMNSGIGERLADMYTKVDLLTFILSDRNYFLKGGWQSFEDTFSTREILLGRGYRSTEAPASLSDHFDKNKTIELDFFDILFEKGVVGLSISYGLTFFLLVLSLYRNFFTQGNWLSPMIALTNALFFFLSFLSGHIVGSGILGIYFGLLNAWLFLPKNEMLSHDSDHQTAPAPPKAS